jgi:RNA polymerase sigma factor (sigma-70 family)
MTDLTAFNEHRPLLFSIAYRMLGSASDAEDVVQDAWLRYRAAADIRSPRAFAATIVTRLCLDRLKSARASREEYVGPWLPEPILTTAAGPGPNAVEGPDVTLQRSESVTLAFLVMLETLSPEERAVFLLREVFDYKHDEIAEMLGLTAANSRQLFHRAKERIRSRGPQSDVAAPASQREVLLRFTEALKDGDARALTHLLTDDVGFWSDGGGKVAAARRPLVGRAEVLNFLVGLHRTATAHGAYVDASLVLAEVNDEPALLIRVGGRLESVFVLSVAEGRITALRVARNPDKLRYIERQLAGRVM